MPNYVHNHLRFLSNDKTILAYLRSRHPGNTAPARFSLNSIKRSPEEFDLPLTPAIKELSILNMQMPELAEDVRQAALHHVFGGRAEKASEAEVARRIEEIRELLSENKTGLTAGTDPDEFERAVTNYRRHRFFSLYDWRMENWGTIEDISAVDEATFDLPTQCIVFQTAWTPPIAALQLLSNTFPSVRFRLDYAPDGSSWTEVEFFPFPPFGY